MGNITMMSFGEIGGRSRDVDLMDYRRATWASVGMLWKQFEPDPETTITRMFPQAGPFVDQMHDIHHGMPVEQRRAVLLELHKLTKLGFEQAEGFVALPFVAHTVAGWFVVQDWAGSGKIQSAHPFLQDIIAALAESLRST